MLRSILFLTVAGTWLASCAATPQVAQNTYKEFPPQKCCNDR